MLGVHSILIIMLFFGGWVHDTVAVVCAGVHDTKLQHLGVVHDTVASVQYTYNDVFSLPLVCACCVWGGGGCIILQLQCFFWRGVHHTVAIVCCGALYYRYTVVGAVS